MDCCVTLQAHHCHQSSAGLSLRAQGERGPSFAFRTRWCSQQGRLTQHILVKLQATNKSFSGAVCASALQSEGAGELRNAIMVSSLLCAASPMRTLRGKLSAPLKLARTRK